jgi:hypothetical protein
MSDFLLEIRNLSTQFETRCAAGPHPSGGRRSI